LYVFYQDYSTNHLGVASATPLSLYFNTAIQYESILRKRQKSQGDAAPLFPAWLHDCGVLVQATGKDKRVNVNDLAVAMTMDRTSPL